MRHFAAFLSSSFILSAVSPVLGAQDGASSAGSEATAEPPAAERTPGSPGEGDAAQGSVFTPPRLVTYVEADYPPRALEDGIEANVVAEIEIGADGRVAGITVVEPAGHGFDEAAVAAIERFIFEPATRNGEPIPAKVLYRYRFFLGAAEPPAEDAPLTATLSGKVATMDGEPIPEAMIVLVPAGEGGEVEDAAPVEAAHPIPVEADGLFSLADLADGAYEIEIIAAGFKPLSVVEELVAGESREVVYRLEVEEALYEVVVRGRRPPREVTRREVTMREITRIPGTSGDALRSVQNMPGMARAPMGSGALIVRGSSPEDSGYYLDQMPIPLLYHFGGLTSVVNSDLLERIDFFPGNYGVRYGGATGGIVEVYPRAPHTDRWHGYVDLDLFDASLLVEGPIGDDWSVAASFRRSWIDAILGAALPEDGGFSMTVAPRYYDYQLIVDYHPSKKDNVRLLGFGSDDKLVFVFGEDVGDNPNFSGGVDFGILFHQGQLRWDHAFSKKASNSINVMSGFQRSDSSFGDQFEFVADAVPIYVRDELKLDPTDRLTIHTGLELETFWAEWSVRAPITPFAEGESFDPLSANEEIVESVNDEWFHRPGWYGELELRPVDDLRMITGVRTDWYGWVGEIGVDPRFVLRYEVIPGTTLKGGIGLFHQPPSETQTEEPFGSDDLELINAVHYSLGVDQKITANIEVGVEGFYKDLSNLVVTSDALVERDGQLVPEQYNNDGVGQVYGLEFLLKHFPTDRFFGWISYTLMKSSRVDHPGEPERPFDFDQTHILTLVASLVLGRGWEAGLRFRLVSGNPETPITGSVYDADSDVYFPLYGRTNSSRMPMFHQLDLRIDKKWAFKYTKFAIYLDIQNVYNQENPEGYQYSYDYSQRVYFNGLPLIPSFGFKLEY